MTDDKLTTKMRLKVKPVVQREKVGPAHTADSFSPQNFFAHKNKDAFKTLVCV